MKKVEVWLMNMCDTVCAWGSGGKILQPNLAPISYPSVIIIIIGIFQCKEKL